VSWARGLLLPGHCTCASCEALPAPPPLAAHPTSTRLSLSRALPAIVVSNDIPSFGTPEWEAFIEKDPNNFQVWLEVRHQPLPSLCARAHQALTLPPPSPFLLQAPIKE
jgi:hypothetical protein